MSKLLQVYQAKPNPTGRDTTKGGSARPEQLLGEWVDIKNVGTESVDLSKVELRHTLFGSRCEPTGRTEAYWSGLSELRPGQVVRIHTGRREDRHLMAAADAAGADLHAYAEQSWFKLNNQCGDTIIVTWVGATGSRVQDSASYSPNPPEGAVLRRSGSSLLPVGTAVTS